MMMQQYILSLFLTIPIVPVAVNDTIDLLDDQNASKWRGYDGKTLPPGWLISDGMLWVDEKKINDKVNDATYKGSRDVIFAGQEFEFFELTLEWKIAKGGNSGIFYHLKEGFGNPSSIGPEYQLIDDENYAAMHPDLKDYNAQFGEKNPELLQDWQKTGADYAMHTANEQEKVLHPAGEWNTTKIVVARGKTEHWLNGKKILSFEPWSDDWNKRRNSGKWKKSENYGKFKTGFIGLQYHGSSLWFRNIKIKAL
jgi:hypothetical protein